MKDLKLLLLIILLGVNSHSINSQEIVDSKIVGLWSMTFKTAGSEGTVILDCQGNHSLNVTECFTIDNIINAAFVRYSGSWQLNSGKL